MEILTLTASTCNGNFYQGDKNNYLLKPADREFKNCSHKPEYYLLKKVGNDMKFVSGFFKTREDSTYSYDVKTTIGVKKMMLAEFENNGDKLTLRSK